MSALCARSIARPAGRAFLLFLVDFRKAKIKKEFRALRSASQGSALRTRSLSRKAGESFISACGREFIFLRCLGLAAVSHSTHRAQWSSRVDHLMQSIECIRQTTHLIDEPTRDGLLP